MSHTPRLSSGYVFKRYLNAIRPRANSAPPVPPDFPLAVFIGQTLTPFPAQTPSFEALFAREDWEQYIAPGTSIQTFESYANLDPLLDAPFPLLNGVTLTIPNPDNGGIPLYDPVTQFIVRDAPNSGRYNTTSGGTNYGNRFYTVADDSSNLQTAFNFAPAISCFGVYLTDLGDFGGSFTVRITRSDNTQFTYTLFLADPDPAPEGDLHFFGFVDAQETYTKVEFFCSEDSLDVWGIDDLVYGLYANLQNP